MQTIRTLTLASIATLVLTAQALAHAHLLSATPALNGAVAAAPTELDLIFSEALDLAFTGVTIAGPDKTAIPTGAAHLGPGHDATLVVPVSASMPAGTYAVEWHALAKDGHKTRGRYTFTVKP